MKKRRLRSYGIILSLILALTLLFGLTACDKGEPRPSSEEETSGESNPPETGQDDNFEEGEEDVKVWLEDLEQLKKDLEWYNAEPFKRYGKEKFYEDYEALKAALPSMKTREEREFALRKLVYSIGDGHIDIWADNDRFDMLPLLFNKLADGNYYIVNTTKNLSEDFAKKVTTINGHKIEDIVKKFGEISNSESENWRLANAIDKLHFKKFYVLSGFAKDEDESINIDGRDYAFYPHILKESWYKALDINNLTNFVVWNDYVDEKPYSTSWYDNDRVLVIEFSDCSKEYEDKPLYEWGLEVRKEVAEKKPEVLVLDLRSNGGGSPSALYTALPEDFFRTEGFINNPKFFIVTNRQTFSSGVTTTHFVKKNWGATHIGTGTGGSAFTTNVSSTAEKVLKKSGLKFRISSDSVSKKAIEFPSEEPTLVIEQDIVDVEDERDVVLDYIINSTR